MKTLLLPLKCARDSGNAAIIDTVMFIISVLFGVGFMTMLFLMSFFLAWDLVLITYVMAYKIKNKVNYVAINHHIYDLTLYKGTYIKTGAKKSLRRVKTLRQKREKRINVFNRISTCANDECENYGNEMDAKAKKCPLCGEKRHIAEILNNVITCVNPDCENFGHELKQEIEECTLCGTETGNLALKFAPAMTKPAVITTFAVAILFTWITFLMNDSGVMEGALVTIVLVLQTAAFSAGIAMGWVSRNKFAFYFAVTAFLIVTLVLRFII